MSIKRLFPMMGINNVAIEDSALEVNGDNPRLFVRDAINIDFTETGRVKVRNGSDRVTELQFKNLWQSKLHNDVFATLEDQLVKVDPVTWGYEVLVRVGFKPLNYFVINNLIYISNEDDIWVYNGLSIQNLTIQTPTTSLLSKGQGTLAEGTYSIAISWLRGQQESALSQLSTIQLDSNDSSIQITLPYCLDQSITQVRVYSTERNGSELYLQSDYIISTTAVSITKLELGMSSRFIGLSAMPAGRMMKYWQGRLVSANRNILRFSEPLAFHLHDERFGFVAMPQRITFIIPVDAGIWVGQVTHVVFLTGTKPDDMNFQLKTGHAPVPDSAIELDASDIGEEISQGGNTTALWLSENGYVIGTSTGQIIELQSKQLKGIVAKSGRSVSLGRRITTIVS